MTALSVQFLQNQLVDYGHCKRWVLAFSGGLDSSVLLHLLHSLISSNSDSLCGESAAVLPEIHVLHVNHGINPEADQWQLRCQQATEHYGFRFHTVTLSNLSKQANENALRTARYQVFESFLQNGDCLLLAHHANDQAETVLLRAMRGGGGAGLAAIPTSRGIAKAVLLRPLLSVSRPSIEAYAKLHCLEWVDDASNTNTEIRRNYIRHEILPRLIDKWPNAQSALLGVAERAAEEQGLLSELAQLDLNECKRESLAGECLSLEVLSGLSKARFANLIRYWSYLETECRPGQNVLDELHSLMSAAKDAQPQIQFKHWQFRRFKNSLYLLHNAQVNGEILHDEEALSWDLSSPIRLSTGSQLQAISARQDAAGQNPQTLLKAGVYQIRWLPPVRCKPVGRAHTQRFKKLLQEYAVAPWERGRLPLLYCGEQLAAVADYWVCEGFQGEKPEGAYRIAWERDTFVTTSVEVCSETSPSD